MSYTDVAQVANAAHNYKILHERDDDDTENSDNGRDQRNMGHQSNRSANFGYNGLLYEEGHYNYDISAKGFKTAGSKDLTCEDWVD
nr:hypothetical protein [Tanacetum cinerariifolium]